MLVLSRQRDETIMIGDEIQITIVDIRGDKVRLGINAPPKIAVHRKEVYEAIRRENEEAAKGVPLEALGIAGPPAARAAPGVSPGPGKNHSGPGARAPGRIVLAATPVPRPAGTGVAKHRAAG